MRAAIYARKSTSDSDKSEELKSVALQIENARRFAAERGWTVLDEHVYVDDNVSGALVSRPGLDRMLAALAPAAGRRTVDAGALPFDALIVRDQSRLIRNADHTTRLIKRILRSGVQLWHYKDKRQVQVGNWEELAIGVQGFMDAGQRIKASQDAREGLAERALRGYSTGGCCYGFTNVPVMGKMASGQQARLYTDYQINESEAAVVLGIFEMYEAGYSPLSIAKTLNGDAARADQRRRFFNGVCPPKPIVGRRGTGSWAPSALRDMLRNERYIGVLSFGRMQTIFNEDGEKYSTKQADQSRIVRTERPDLRIVPDGLWQKAHERMRKLASKHGERTMGATVWGRAGDESPHLLSGLGECGCCGHSMVMIGGRRATPGRAAATYYYGCGFHRHRGRTICDNDLSAPMAEADELVISRIKADLLSPAAVDFVITTAIKLVADRRAEPADTVEGLQAALQRERKMRDNFLDLIATGRPPMSVLERLTALDASIAEKERQLREHDAVRADGPIELGLERLRRSMLARVEQFDELLTRNIPSAREVIRKIVDGRIGFYPDRGENRPDRFRLKWGLNIEPLVSEGYTSVSSPRGTVAWITSVPLVVEATLRAA